MHERSQQAEVKTWPRKGFVDLDSAVLSFGLHLDLTLTPLRLCLALILASPGHGLKNDGLD